ncbi:MAG: glutathione S-transferase [Zetaproteobacteria bacterium]|nr:glutathione S-transferase [Zetaproteobacteria bacterium]
MTQKVFSILYSFRRCPYAMRARLALLYSGIVVELREVTLKNKPPELLQASNKATVPVLICDDGKMLDESHHIMLWACQKSDPEAWLNTASHPLIHDNDTSFKSFLDMYKYSDRFPEYTQTQYRDSCGMFLQRIEQSLQHSSYLAGKHRSFVDMAIAPFIRQFSMVEPTWFEGKSNVTPYPNTLRWLQSILQSEFFRLCMKKYPAWQAGDEVSIFPNH